jgi:hypothetical protein
MPIPERGKTSRNITKLGETEHSIADTSMNPTPITSIVLGLYLTLMTLRIRAEKNATMDEIVLTCPVTPTVVLNVCPISISNIPIRTLGIPDIILDSESVGSTIFPIEVLASSITNPIELTLGEDKIIDSFIPNITHLTHNITDDGRKGFWECFPVFSPSLTNLSYFVFFLSFRFKTRYSPLITVP